MAKYLVPCLAFIIGLWLWHWEPGQEHAADGLAIEHSVKEDQQDGQDVELLPGEASNKEGRALEGSASQEALHVSSTDGNVEVTDDRSQWGIDEWNLEKIVRYEKGFTEEGTRWHSRMLLHTSIAVILNAQGRTIRNQDFEGLPFPNNSKGHFGFAFNDWVVEFGPGEFPEYEALLPYWEQGGRGLKEGEELITLDDEMKNAILDRALEARLLLQAKLGVR